jgi:hypothetical protein
MVPLSWILHPYLLTWKKHLRLAGTFLALSKVILEAMFHLLETLKCEMPVRKTKQGLDNAATHEKAYLLVVEYSKSAVKVTTMMHKCLLSYHGSDTS